MRRQPDPDHDIPPPEALILSAPLAGLQSQALGLAEAAGFRPTLRTLTARFPWTHVAPALWPDPARRLGLHDIPPGILFGAGGMAAAALAGLRAPDRPTVQIQNPRIDPRRFDVIVANLHDNLTGPNVITIRTALHRVSPGVLASARDEWGPRLAHLPRPLVSVLVGGSNGRFRLGAAEAHALAHDLATMLRRDRVGMALTPSRRTDPAARAILESELAPLGAYIWDMRGDNPYFGLLACADVIIATIDSVSMVSEAAATAAPVLLADLPGRSRRIRAFLGHLLDAGRVRPFKARLETWNAAPLDDTAWAASEVRRMLGL